MATGMAECAAPPQETIRDADPMKPTTGSTRLPHLSIHEDIDETPEDAQLVIKEMLGQGGMGIVHLAQQPLLDRHVAIKRVRSDAPSLASRSLFREARFMGSLEHPNIIPVHALGADADGSPILVMKCIDGISWARLIAEPEHPAWARWTGWASDPVERNLEILIEVCRAVSYAHSRQILHRDVKPDNVMLGEHGEVYVLDWGVAMRLDRPRRAGIVGTPAYMAPEMVEPDGVLDPRTDVFLLGACLHEVLTSRPPHRGTTLKEALAAAHASLPPDLPGIPVLLGDIARRAMAPDPANRFPDPDALQEALMSWLRTRGSAQLATAASAKLDHLLDLLAVPEPNPSAVSAAYTASLFGFEQALQSWPENVEAHAGLQSAYRHMARYQIRRENLDHASALIAKLDQPGSLAETFEVARTQHTRRMEMARDQDWAVASRERLIFWCTLCIVGISSTAFVLSGAVDDPAEYTARHLVGLSIGFAGGCLVLIAIGRKWLYSNRLNASITDAVLALVIMLSIHRLLEWLYIQNEVPDILAVDALIIASCMSTMKRSIGWLAWFLASGSIVTSLCILAFPGVALHLFGLSLAIGTLTGGLVFGLRGRKNSAS